ncbi:hypothetical protein MRB53_006967 [Persea americana]|uniref:Uncharacterized protein n=1 Tax=Persea americana TaxID=3435 RepID=A0ACC2MHP0_PERAE|nr:hypothetical protein MRB53_006967 [Persea americana]
MNTALWKSAKGFKNLAENPPTQSSNLLLTLCNLGRLKEALQTLTSTKPISSIHPSLYSSLLQLCIDSNAEKEGRFVHDHLLRNGVVPDLCLNNKLINFYSRIGDVVAARDLFDEMTQPSLVSWTALISGYSRNGYPKEALEVFLEMRRSGFRGNQFTFGSVLRSALVDFHSKCGKIEDARGVFERMSNRDVVSWNVVIGGYAVQGLGADAFGMFRLMLRDGMIPDHFTFGSILRACGGVRSCPKDPDQCKAFI